MPYVKLLPEFGSFLWLYVLFFIYSYTYGYNYRDDVLVLYTISQSHNQFQNVAVYK